VSEVGDPFVPAKPLGGILGEIKRLFDEYRLRGVCIDTNLLVLLVVGFTTPDAITQHKRTSGYTLRDFDVLHRFCSGFQRRVTLPHVLAEASNFLRSERERATLRALVSSFVELTIPSVEAVARPEYIRLGLTDAALLARGTAQDDYLLLTADGQLAAAARYASAPVIAFDVLRPLPLLVRD
jgi:hypothetical protein